MVETSDIEFNKKRLKHCKTVEKFVPELKREIEGKRLSIMTEKDLEKKIGPTYKSWQTRYCLFDNGIIIHRTRKDHGPGFLVRARTPEDTLPYTLKKHIELNIRRL